MEYDDEHGMLGDIPPNLESLAGLPERAIQTVRQVGETVVKLVYGQETATSFDSDSAVYAQ